MSQLRSRITPAREARAASSSGYRGSNPRSSTRGLTSSADIVSIWPDT